MATNNADWIRQLSEPVRVKPSRPWLSPFHTSDTQPFPRSKNLSWFRLLDNPVRPPKGLPTPEQSFLAYVPAKTQNAPNSNFAEQTQYSKYAFPWSEPIRSKAGLSAQQQQALAFVGAAPFPESTSVSRWLFPLAEPVRLKYRPTAEPLSLTPVAVTTLLQGWHYPWSESIRAKYSALSPELSYTAFIQAQPSAPSIDGWGYAWSAPLRRLPASADMGLATAAPIIPVPNPPGPAGQYTVSGLYVIDQFTNNTVVYDYSGGVSHRTN